jgi:hypothetical protein
VKQLKKINTPVSRPSLTGMKSQFLLIDNRHKLRSGIQVLTTSMVKRRQALFLTPTRTQRRLKAKELTNLINNYNQSLKILRMFTL